MTVTATERPPIVWRVALSGSQTWLLKPAWRAVPHKDLDEQLARCRPGDTFILRHGGARRGADRIAHEWFEDRTQGGHGVIMIEEQVPADWDPCVEQDYIDIRGVRVKACPGPHHRRPSQHSTAPDGCICPRKGMLRNPDVVHHPQHPVNVALFYCVNNSPGTMATFDHARKHDINHTLRSVYRPRPEKAASTVPDARGEAGGDGDGAPAGRRLHDAELARA